MKRPRARNPLVLLLLLAVCLAPGPRAAETEDKTIPETATSQTAAPATGTEQQPGGNQPENEETVRTLKQRYREDPTGVRARLGMCRRGQGGHGGGHHRRYRGGEQWNTP